MNWYSASNKEMLIWKKNLILFLDAFDCRFFWKTDHTEKFITNAQKISLLDKYTNQKLELGSKWKESNQCFNILAWNQSSENYWKK